MPPKRRSVKLPFPVKGLNETFGYEDQPRGTSVDVQNVRSFPASSTDPTSGNSKASGRARGGQRPGLTKYVSSAHTANTSIQSIHQMAYSEFTPINGRGHAVIREDTGGSFVLVDNLGNVGASLGVASETYQLGQWGRDGFVYTASVDSNDKLIMRKTNAISVMSWDWTDTDSPAVQLNSSGTRQVAGMTVFGDYVYVWVRDINGVNGEAIYRVKTSDGKLRETTSGNGTQSDYWLVSEDQSTAAFKDFYPSSGETTNSINPMVAGNGMLSFLCYNNSGKTASASTKTAEIAYNADDAAVLAALEGVTHLDGKVTVAGGPLNTAAMTITFIDTLANQDVAVFERTDGGEYTTGTIVYDHAGGTPDRKVTLTGGTWPLWAASGVITISGVDYTVDARTSGTVITLESDSNPGEDITDATSYSLVDGVFQMTTAHGDKGNSTVVTITRTGATSEGFKLAHDGRICLQAINLDNGLQMYARELQPYGTGATTAHTSNEEFSLAVDENGNFYCLSRYSTGSFTYVVTKMNSVGVQQWQQTNAGTSRSLCYDYIGKRLGVVGGNVYGGGKSFATVRISDGAKINDLDAHGITNWNNVYQDEQGGFRLFRNNSSSNVARVSEAEPPSDLVANGAWLISDGDNVQTGASCAAIYAFNPQNSLSVRQTKQLAVAGGVVKEFDSDGWYALPSGGGTIGTPALDPGRDVIFAAQLGTRLYFTDGLNNKYYDAATNKVVAWTTTAGTLPADSNGRRPTLIENWRSRIVMAGVESDPQEYYMSRQGDAADWNYTPNVLTETQAVSGVNAPAGKSPDAIRCIIPVNDDILVWGCDHSVWMMTGDPMLGGRIDNVVDGIGMPWGRPWCRDSGGVVYFFGTRGGVYRFAVGQGMSKITVGSIEERLSTIDLDKNIIRLVWNEREQGLHVFITPLNPFDSTFHYFYDIRSESWWLDKFDATTNSEYVHNPKEVHILDGLDPNDRVVLLGGWDGFLRKWDVTASNDDTTAIDSYAYLGPLVSENLGLVKMNELRVQVGKNSSNVSTSVFIGDNAEDAYAQTTAHYTATFVPGRNVSERRKAISHAIYLKFGNNTVSQRWVMERAEADLELTARKFARIY
jgi:hypothetical protein